MTHTLCGSRALFAHLASDACPAAAFLPCVARPLRALRGRRRFAARVRATRPSLCSPGPGRLRRPPAFPFGPCAPLSRLRGRSLCPGQLGLALSALRAPRVALASCGRVLCCFRGSRGVSLARYAALGPAAPAGPPPAGLCPAFFAWGSPAFPPAGVSSGGGCPLGGAVCAAWAASLAQARSEGLSPSPLPSPAPPGPGEARGPAGGPAGPRRGSAFRSPLPAAPPGTPPRLTLRKL